MRKERRDNLLGFKFGLLVVVRDITEYGFNRPRWVCKCECGNYHEAYSQSLKNGQTSSCGCLTRKKRRSVSKSHGMSKTPEHRTWTGLRQRCLNPKNDRWKSYGGRGIAVCERWDKFENFYSDMGPRLDGMTIDRIDNDGDYEPSNCRWATNKEQQNNRANNVKIFHNGKTKTVSEWCDLLNLNYGMVFTRIVRGWDGGKALTTPCDSNQIVLSLGNETKTIIEWSVITKIDRTVLYTRWVRGWSDERILTTPVKKKQTEYSELEYSGKTQSLSEWCKELNLKRRIIWKRLKRGWSIKDSFEAPELNNALKLKSIRK